MTLHRPDKVRKDVGLIEQAIREWDAGTSTKALVSCKGKYEEKPEHSEYIDEYDKNRRIIRCSSWRNPLNSLFSC